MKRPRNAALVLIVGVPLTAVLMGIVTLVIAFGNPDRPVRGTLPALDKRSWVEAREPGNGPSPAASAGDDRQTFRPGTPSHDR